jgi:hypothetical protein
MGSYSVGGDLVGSLPNPSLVSSGVTAGTYGSNTKVPQITVDSKGRVTAVNEVTIVGGGGGGGASPLTTKGDIWVYSTADTRLAVGSNGQILSADSTTATGLKWIPAPTSAVWGSITGSLASQTDLSTALAAKANTSSLSLVATSGLYSDLSGKPTLGSLAAKSTVTLTTDVTGILPAANGGAGAVNGLMKANGSGLVSVAVAGTDYLTPTGNGSGLTGITESQVTNLTTDLAAKAPLASPALTGSPTAPTQTSGDNSTKIATTAYVDKLGSTSLIRNETPGGLVNGANINYTTASTFAAGSLKVYLNGQRLNPGASNDYTEGTQAFTMNYAPATGDVLLIDYETTNTAFIQGSNSIVVQETPTGLVNGSNAAFTTQLGKYVANSLEVFINGLQQVKTTDYAETTPGSGIFTFVTAPLTGDLVRISYQFSTGASGNADTVDGIHASATPTANNLLPLDSNGFMPTAALGGAWTAYTPSVAAVAGSFTTASATGRYTRIGNTIHFKADVTITTVGTGTGLLVGLPVAAQANFGLACYGREDAINGAMAIGKLQTTTTVSVNKYDNTNIVSGGSGSVIRLAGTYEAA